MTTPITLMKGAKLDLFLARLIMKAMLALAVVFLFAVIQWIRYGVTQDYPVLLIGSALSALTLYTSGIVATAERGRRSWELALAGFAGYVPYVFGGYLIFYRGLWSLTGLKAGFSGGLLIKAAAFVMLGYAVVLGIYRLTEFQGKVHDGTIILVE